VQSRRSHVSGSGLICLEGGGLGACFADGFQTMRMTARPYKFSLASAFVRTRSRPRPLFARLHCTKGLSGRQVGHTPHFHSLFTRLCRGLPPQDMHPSWRFVGSAGSCLFVVVVRPAVLAGFGTFGGIPALECGTDPHRAKCEGSACSFGLS
jgi:hypothetical protein